MGQLLGVWTGANFLETLAQHLLDSYPDPLQLGRTWVILPTRRGTQELHHCLRRLKKNLILPRLLSLADLEAGDYLTPTLPPVLSPLAQQGLLIQLLERQGHRFSMALGLSQELLKLFEEAETAEVDLSLLQTLNAGQSSRYWQQTLAFLSILTTHWPTILKELAHITSAAHRRQIMADWCHRWQTSPPDFPIVIAGSTGTRPSTARLMKTVLRLPQGQVILPAWDGLAFKDLPPTHPSYAIQQLLGFLGETFVQPLGNTSRCVFVRTLMQPASTEPTWQVDAMPVVVPVTCATQILEARMIALLAQKGVQAQKKVCIITPDQTLTQLIEGELKRWGLVPEISQGMPLKKTPAGVFLQLTAALLGGSIKPAQLMAVLKHPLCHFLQDVTALEKRFREERTQIVAAQQLQFKIPLQKSGSLADFLITHFRWIEELAGIFPEPLQDFWQSLTAAAPYFPLLSSVDYVQLLKRQLEQTTVPQPGRDPIHILGTLEARLFSADMVILAGLNEGSWPATLPPDPWLTPRQRQVLGLPPLERQIGLAAHDFCLGLAAPQIYVTRAAVVNGEPTLPSRWYERLTTLIPEEPGPEVLDCLEEHFSPCKQPAPSPPVSMRPYRLSVSGIQRLMQDPYVFYAASILKLRPLPPLEKPLGAADWGNLLHRILETGDLACGESLIQAVDAEPLQLRFWLQRWRQLKNWLEAYWLQNPFQEAWCEISGEIKFGAYTITARADRLEHASAGEHRVIDFKTGQVPSQRQVQEGLYPQLPLEGLILHKGGFSILTDKIALQYWKLKGYGDPIAEVTNLPESLIESAEEGLQQLLSQLQQIRFYAAPEEAYLDYAPLIRRQEWGGI